jgi:hypothetical protein
MLFQNYCAAHLNLPSTEAGCCGVQTENSYTSIPISIQADVFQLQSRLEAELQELFVGENSNGGPTARARTTIGNSHQSVEFTEDSSILGSFDYE